LRFDRESYRKLYVAESLEHRQLSLFARGLRDYLLRFAEEDGTLLRGSANAAEDLCRVLGASAGERRHVLAATGDLMRIGYLTLDQDGRLWITRYVEAQERRSPGALRQQRYRDNHRDVTRDADSNATSDVTYSKLRDIAKKPPSGVSRARARRAPADWEPKPEHLNLGLQVGVAGDAYTAEIAKFRDHEFDTARSDWDAAFRNWLRKSVELRRKTIVERQQPQNYVPSEQVPYHRILR
jgi:hypothetical protein